MSVRVVQEWEQLSAREWVGVAQALPLSWIPAPL